MQVLASETPSRNEIFHEMQRIGDLEKLAIKLSGGPGLIGLSDVVVVYQSIQCASRIATVLKNCSADDSPCSRTFHGQFTDKIIRLCVKCVEYSRTVSKSIDVQHLDNLSDVKIDAACDPTLTRIQRKIDAKHHEIMNVVDDVAKDLECSPKMDKNPQYGYYMKLPKKSESLLRNNKSYSVMDMKKDGLKFTTPSLVKYNREYNALCAEYTDAQKKIADNLIILANNQSDNLYALSIVLMELDVLNSFATVSTTSARQYVRPSIGGSEMQLIGSRHPCVEKQINMDFVANDVMLSTTGPRYSVLTGPNMGGKSTYIRAIGDIILMCQIGCFVPCDSAKIPLFDSILCRIGASDCTVKVRVMLS